MTKEIEIAAIQRDIANAQHSRDLANVLDRLESNSDFQKLIGQSYFRDEAIRLVHLKGDPDAQDAATQARIINDMDAIGTLSSFFRTIRHNGALANKAIVDGESMIEQLHTEED